MRPIKFRGKRIDNGEWTYGNHYGTGRESLERFWMDVADELIDILTIGQFAGLLDKNGKEAYHKDISMDNEGDKYLVEWDGENGRFFLQGIGFNCLGVSTDDLNLVAIKEQKIVGDVFQNKDLLEKTKNESEVNDEA